MTPDLIAGRYKVVREVGRGGMGTVWLCRDQVLGREVAVKRIGALPGESATDAARALREARTSAALNHRNVVSVFDIVDGEDGGAWLVMEYVPSRTLGQVIREDGPLPPRRAAEIGAQVAAGLAAAHKAGTIHRDVKPGNILLAEDGVAKISDFGIARGAGDDQLTRTGLVTGTPSYFSPELARGADPGPESDVYALGATLYMAVEGRAPYPEHRNPIALLQTIAAEEPPPPENAGALAGPIARMMDRDSRSRWTMADAAHTLRRIADQGDTSDGRSFAIPVSGASWEDTATRTTPRPAAPAASSTPAPHREGADAPSAGDTPARGGVAAPAPATRGTPARGTEDGDERPKRRTAGWLVAAAALLLAILGLGYAMMTGDPGREDRASAQAESPSPSDEESAARSESPSPTPRETPTRQTPPPDPGAAMEQAVEEYFSVMPANTDAGWQRLAPSMKAQGRGGYEDWWGSIRSVDLQQVDAVDGQQQVDIVLTYYFEDGRATQETQRLTLEESRGGYLIADDAVLSSRTVS
jgi:serine/threonine protein kinase